MIEYYAVLAITIASILAIWYIMKTRIGLAFLAIRENELEARAAGIDPVRYRLLAFALSALTWRVLPGRCRSITSATLRRNFTGLITRSGRLPMSYWAGSARLPARLSGLSCSPLSGKGSRRRGSRLGGMSLSGSFSFLQSYSCPGGL